MEKYLDSTRTPLERAQDLLGKLSLEEKMAQIRGVMPFEFLPGDKHEEWIRGRGIGQVSALRLQMLETPLPEAIQWLRDLQEKIIRESPHHIPAIFHMEGVNGAYFHGAANYPTGISRGAAFDPELEYEIGKNVARIENAAGITQVLAPVLDVARDPRLGRFGEAYGEDATLASSLGVAFTKGIQESKDHGREMAATAKHFMGFHTSRGGFHGAGSSIGNRELNEVYGKSFQAAITEANLKGVMPCYNVIDGIPFSASYQYLTQTLRNQMGFDGTTLSDYGAVSQVFDTKKVGDSYADAGFRCLSAGMDYELPNPVAYSDELQERFRNGIYDAAVLDTAVLRILTEKFRMGLFENPFGTLEGLEAAIKEERESGAARKAAQESVVLLKNDGILPLNISEKPGKIVLVGPHAINARFYFGGYTHLSMMESGRAAQNSLAGVGSADKDIQETSLIKGTKVQRDDNESFDSVLSWIDPGCRSLLQELRERYPDSDIAWAKGYPIAGSADDDYPEALEMIREADLVILTLGGKYGTGSVATMGEGVDASSIQLPPCQEEFIRKASEFGKPMIGIHFGGKPISSDAADQCLSAVIEAFCPGAFGAEVLVDILTGKLNPSGKLPVSVLYNAGQIPLVYCHEYGSGWHKGESIGFSDYVDCPQRPRYYFGYGLSYTDFKYSDLEIEKSEVAPDQPIKISVKVKNTGKVDGTEIVQLYLTDEYASVARPVKELAGFARVSLKAGETKSITFTVHPSKMAFLDEHMNWKIEKGDFSVQVGASSEDIRLRGKFTVTDDQLIDGKTRAFYAKADIHLL